MYDASMPDVDLVGVIDEIYAAVEEPDRWDRAIASVARVLGGAGATLEIHRRRDRALTFFRGVGMPDDGITAYVAHYHACCPRLPWGRYLAPGTPIYDHMFLTEAEMSRLEFYEDFLAPAGFRHLLGGTIENDDATLALLAVHRLIDRGHPDAEEIERCRALLPHLRRAVGIQQWLERWAARAGRLTGALSALGTGVVAIDRGGAVLLANDEAARLCSSERGLALGGRLEATEPLARDRVARLLAAAVAELPAGGIEIIGRPPIAVAAVPLTERPASRSPLPLEAPGEIAAIVYLADSTRSPVMGREVLMSGFGVTAAEADLAVSLAGGASMAEWANARAITRNTARTHLARLRGKLGVRSQVELVRILFALFPPMLRDLD